MIYGMLRLTGGDDSSGRLEINFDGRWGTVCSRNFAAIDGHVACRQIGFKGVISISNVTNAWLVSLHLHTCAWVLYCDRTGQIQLTTQYF